MPIFGVECNISCCCLSRRLKIGIHAPLGLGPVFFWQSKITLHVSFQLFFATNDGQHWVVSNHSHMAQLTAGISGAVQAQTVVKTPTSTQPQDNLNWCWVWYEYDFTTTPPHPTPPTHPPTTGTLLWLWRVSKAVQTNAILDNHLRLSKTTILDYFRLS